MSRTKTPSYCVHKRSNRAYVTLDGKQVPLGEANTPQSQAEYDHVLAEWLTHRRQPKPVRATEDAPPTISMLCEAFWTHALVYYTKALLDDAGNEVLDARGHVTRIDSGELDHFRQLIRPLRRLYGATIAKDFNCVEAEALRDAMIRPHADYTTGRMRSGWSRPHANRQMSSASARLRLGCDKEPCAGRDAPSRSSVPPHDRSVRLLCGGGLLEEPLSAHRGWKHG